MLPTPAPALDSNREVTQIGDAGAVALAASLREVCHRLQGWRRDVQSPRADAAATAHLV